jgi:hypothetical protein
VNIELPKDSQPLSHIVLVLHRPDSEPLIVDIPFEPNIPLVKALAEASESMVGVEFPA